MNYNVFTSCSLQGLRPDQEDRTFYNKFYHNSTNFYIGGVIDGHFGAKTSHFLANYIPSQIEAGIKGLGYQNNNDRKIDQIKNIGKQVVMGADESLKKENVGESGAVLAFFIFFDTNLIIFNLGDCFVWVYNPIDKIQFETEAHSIENEKEVKRVTDLGGNFRRGYCMGRLQPTRVLGDFESKDEREIFSVEPEITAIKLITNSIVIVGSDGLTSKHNLETDQYSHVEFKDYIDLVENCYDESNRFNNKSHTLTADLCSKALDTHHSSDNITALCLFINELY